MHKALPRMVVCMVFVLHRLTYLNTWSSAGTLLGKLMELLGDGGLPEKVRPWGGI